MTAPLSDKAIAPCPFCGFDKPRLRDNRCDAFWIECPVCDAEVAGFDTPEEALAAWNRRAPVDAASHGEDEARGYEFEVFQGGAWQAGGSAPTLAEAEREADHYAMMYGQDGPVEVKFYERRALAASASGGEGQG